MLVDCEGDTGIVGVVGFEEGVLEEGELGVPFGGTVAVEVIDWDDTMLVGIVVGEVVNTVGEWWMPVPDNERLFPETVFITKPKITSTTVTPQTRISTMLRLLNPENGHLFILQGYSFLF
jgi:hypothetical protein